MRQRATSRYEQGFSLVEVMVTMTIALLVLFAGLSAFDAFDRGASSNGRLTDAEDNGRRDIGNMVRILRDAGSPAPLSGSLPPTVTRASANDIVFNSTSWPNESATGSSGTHVERLCLDTASKTVWFDGLRAGTAGPSDPGVNCPSTAAGWTHMPMSRNVANTAALPVFQIGSSPIRSIGIRLRTESGTVTTSRHLTLNSGGTMRGALPPQIDVADVSYVCDSDGSGKALLSLTGHSELKLGASGAITVGPAKVLVSVAAHATTQVALTVTNPLGLQTLLFKDVTCP